VAMKDFKDDTPQITWDKKFIIVSFAACFIGLYINFQLADVHES
jgi:hypothetical protein